MLSFTGPFSGFIYAQFVLGLVCACRRKEGRKDTRNGKEKKKNNTMRATYKGKGREMNVL
jgi:hypothetical protein